MTGAEHNGGQFLAPMGQTPNCAEGCSITLSGRRSAPAIFTVNPEPVLVTHNDALDGLLPGREWREILSGPPPCGPNQKPTVGVEAADKRRAGK